MTSRLSLGTFATGAARLPSTSGAGIPYTIKTNGPTISSASLGTPVATGTATVHQPYTIAISDFAASHNPAWFAGLKSYKRAHGDTHAVPVGHLNPQTSSVTWTNAVDLGTGSTNWDIGFSYIGANDDESTIVWPAALSNINPGALLDVGANAIGWKQLVGDTSGDTTTPIADTSNKRLLHAGMSTEYQTNFNSSGNVQKSTMFVTTTPNTIAYVTDATIEFSWTGTGPYTVAIWYDNGTASTDSSVVYPDGSPTINLGHTTSAAPSYSETNVAGGTNYYVVLSRAANGTVSMTVQKTPFTVTAFASYFADGGIVPAAAQGATPLFTASGSGGGGGKSGGGGGHYLN